MTIDIALYYATPNGGRKCAVDAVATILSSPREGFDADKLAALEQDLGLFIGKRLNDALKNGDANNDQH